MFVDMNIYTPHEHVKFSLSKEMIPKIWDKLKNSQNITISETGHV